MDETQIFDILSNLLLGGRLPPGTKLVEQKIAKVFGVSRERIRKVLHRLGHERLLDLIPNRGAFVAEPTLEEARRIYDARRIVEAGIVLDLADGLSKDGVEALERHLSLEEEAVAADDRPASIRLSGHFHLLLAQMTGSEFVERQLQELVSRTAMMVAFYEPRTLSACACDEHASIIRALVKRDGAAAARAMKSHLSLIDTRLRPSAVATEERDVEDILREEIARFALTDKRKSRYQAVAVD